MGNNSINNVSNLSPEFNNVNLRPSRLEDPLLVDELQPYWAKFDNEAIALLEDEHSSIEAILDCIKRSARFSSHELAKLTQIFQSQERRIENFEKDQLLGSMYGRGSVMNFTARYGSLALSTIGAAAFGLAAIGLTNEHAGRAFEFAKAPLDEIKNNSTKEYDARVRDSEGRKGEMRQSADRQTQTTDELGRNILQGEQSKHDTKMGIMRA